MLCADYRAPGSRLGKKKPGAELQPFYILELGTGSGRLSYYILKKIEKLQQQLHLQTIQFRYIMSDFTERNLKYWKTHPALQRYLNNGVLDFAIFNMEEDTTLQFHQAGTVLTEGSMMNPLTVIANYIFDTVSHDAFTVSDGKIQESLVSVTTDWGKYTKRPSGRLAAGADHPHRC